MVDTPHPNTPNFILGRTALAKITAQHRHRAVKWGKAQLHTSSSTISLDGNDSNSDEKYLLLLLLDCYNLLKMADSEGGDAHMLHVSHCPPPPTPVNLSRPNSQWYYLLLTINGSLFPHWHHLLLKSLSTSHVTWFGPPNQTSPHTIKHAVEDRRGFWLCPCRSSMPSEQQACWELWGRNAKVVIGDR